MAQTKLSQTDLKDFENVVTAWMDDKGIKTVSKTEVATLAETYLKDNPDVGVAPMTLAWKTIKDHKVTRGVYTVSKFGGSVDIQAPAPKVTKTVKTTKAPKTTELYQALPGTNTTETKTQEDNRNWVPDVDPRFVPDANYKTLLKLFKTGRFFPVYISGVTGCGKTTGTEQASAKLKRELFTISITAETNEDDLLGGFRLIDGETVWFDGPVVQALKRGGVLLLDEVDLASPKVLCLQPVLSGKGIFLKKINQYVYPAPGFTVVATANTKGQGDDTGKYIGTGNLNEAFLDRFPITMDADYPDEKLETEILRKVWAETEDLNEAADATIKNLVAWANLTRRSYKDEVIDDVISVRRLVNIVEATSIFGRVKKALELTLNRFDEMTREALIDLYKKIDATFGEEDQKEVATQTKTTGYTGDDIPF